MVGHKKNRCCCDCLREILLLKYLFFASNPKRGGTKLSRERTNFLALLTFYLYEWSLNMGMSPDSEPKPQWIPSKKTLFDMTFVRLSTHLSFKNIYINY